MIAAALRKEFGLTLFGFDCIIPSSGSASGSASGSGAPTGPPSGPVSVAADAGQGGEGGQGGGGGGGGYCEGRPSHIEIIDVNFFPSYKEVGDFPRRLKAYLRRRAGLI